MALRTITYLLLLTLCASCGVSSLPSSDIIPWYPSEKILRSGIAHKYYYHQNQLSTGSKTTNIYYRSYELQENEFHVKQFNSAFELTNHKSFSYNPNQIFQNHETHYTVWDTSSYTFTENNFLNKDLEIAKLSKSRTNKFGYKINIQTARSFKGDTLIHNYSAKAYNLKLDIESTNPDGVIRLENRVGTDYFVDGMGLLYSYRIDSLYRTDIELIEQMSLDEFIKRSNHGTKRIAFIDTSNTLSPARKDLLCNTIDNINDYYNEIPHARIHGGKGTLWELIKKHKPEIAKESGYLSFHFVINCKGEVGWFTTEEADLNYRGKKFSKQTIDQLHELLSAHKTWDSISIRNEPRDVFAYIIFKIDNGKIIEILP